MIQSTYWLSASASQRSMPCAKEKGLLLALSQTVYNCQRLNGLSHKNEDGVN